MLARRLKWWGFVGSAVQRWAKRFGGVEAALARPEMPPEGPLKEAISRAMRRDLKYSSVPMDAGFWSEEEEEEERMALAQQQQQQQGEEGEDRRQEQQEQDGHQAAGDGEEGSLDRRH